MEVSAYYQIFHTSLICQPILSRNLEIHPTCVFSYTCQVLQLSWEITLLFHCKNNTSPLKPFRDLTTVIYIRVASGGWPSSQAQRTPGSQSRLPKYPYPCIRVLISPQQRPDFSTDLSGLWTHLPLQSNVDLIFSTICPLAEGSHYTLPCRLYGLHNASWFDSLISACSVFSFQFSTAVNSSQPTSLSIARTRNPSSNCLET